MVQVIDITFDRADGPDGLLPALQDVCKQAAAAIADGYSFIVLSDRAFGPTRVPIPSLLATGAVHHQLVSLKQRTRVGLLVETGEVSREEVQLAHKCLLSSSVIAVDGHSRQQTRLCVYVVCMCLCAGG